MSPPEGRGRGLRAAQLRVAVILAALALAPAPLRAEASAAVPLAEASVTQLAGAAAQALAEGQADRAALLATELLRRDPKNPLGHYLFARLALGAGDGATARRAAKASFAHAQSPRQHYEAARLAAQVALAGQRWNAAQYWARQTIQFAPDAAARRLGVADYRRLRAANPLAFNIKLGMKPSNNVNGGADERANVIDGFSAVGWLSDDAMALRGVAGTADVSASWRLMQDAHSETRLGLSGYARAVELAGQPMLVPAYPPGTPPPPAEEIRNETYSAASLAARLSHVRAFGADTSGAATIEAGRSWQAGDPAYDWAALRLEGARRLNGAWRLNFGTSFEERAWAGSSRQDWRRGLSLGLKRSTAAGEWGLGLSASSLDSNRAQQRNWTLSGVLDYAPNARLGPLALSLSAGLSATVYPDYSLLGFRPEGGRQDDTAFAELGLWAPKLGLAAFAPEVKIQAVRVHSNVSRFSRSELSLAVGWRSAF